MYVWLNTGMADKGKWKKTVRLVLLGLTSLFSIFCLVVYAQGLMLNYTENDKSVLFWYLPILFAGLISARWAYALFRALSRDRK